MQFDAPSTFALSRSRIFRDSPPLLAHGGIEPADDPETSRKLILQTNQASWKMKHPTITGLLAAVRDAVDGATAA